MCKEFCFFLKVVILTVAFKKNILNYKQSVTILAILSCPSGITAIITYTCCLVAASARYITDMLTVPSKKVILTFYKKVTNIFFLQYVVVKKIVFSSKNNTVTFCAVLALVTTVTPIHTGPVDMMTLL